MTGKTHNCCHEKAAEDIFPPTELQKQKLWVDAITKQVQDLFSKFDELQERINNLNIYLSKIPQTVTGLPLPGSGGVMDHAVIDLWNARERIKQEETAKEERLVAAVQGMGYTVTKIEPPSPTLERTIVDVLHPTAMVTTVADPNTMLMNGDTT